MEVVYNYWTGLTSRLIKLVPIKRLSLTPTIVLGDSL